MLKRLLQILCLLPICATGSAYAVDCASNEFKYIDNNNNETCIENKFQITTTNDTDKFVFTMTAKGTFYIDWGDGNVEMINRTGTTITEYSHDYANANTYTIKFGGVATGYNTSRADSVGGAIVFGLFRNATSIARETNNTYDKVAGISGSLGALFPTIGNGTTASTQPIFIHTFGGCSNLTSSIPSTLFSGLSGIPTTYMFYGTFYGCSGLTDTDIDDPNNPGKKYAIPPTLFAGISGAPAINMFFMAFRECSGLTGTIPSGLFSGISGAPASNMFRETFRNCSGLTGSIPANLFSGISGAPATYMFNSSFYGCSGLTGTDIDDPNNPGKKYAIPPTLFAGISGAPAMQMFLKTFYGCSELSGTIPGNLFSGISGAPAPNMFQEIFRNDSKLTGAIPANLFSGISGAPATSMFNSSFYGCSGLTGSIPENLFAGIVGKPATQMFYYTFQRCSGLTGTIPANLFSGILGAPADSMFTGTFINCNNLTGSIPENLFAGIVGKPATNMFYRTFYNCTNLGKNAVGGTSMYYIPPELFAGIDKTSTATDMMTGVFAYTGLLTTCPSGTNQYITGFESWFSGKQSCTECPVNYPNYNTTNDQCYAQITYIDSDDNTLLKTEDVYYDANNPNGFTLPSYSPTKPDTILDNWTTGDGTVIGSADLLTGNQVVYSDWGFHCDSGHYFHAGNEQICTAETKRTTYALVIKPDANHTYYIHATPNSEHDYTINSSSIHKMKVNYNGTIYNLHDASVYFSE